MARGVQILQWDQTAIIWATLANKDRDPSLTPKPYHPADIHPYKTKADYEPEPDEGSDQDPALIAKIKSQYKVTKIHGLKSSNSRRRSIPGTDGPGQ